MELSALSEFKNGVPIPFQSRSGRLDYAFLPKKLPVSWAFPTGLWPLVADAREALGRLTSATIGSQISVFLLTRHLQRREALRSSRLEGTEIGAKELLLFEIDQKSADDVRSADQRETHNCDLALQHAWELAEKGARLDAATIKSIHKVLMTGLGREDRTMPGEFRTLQNHVGLFTPPPAENVPELIENLIAYIDHSEHDFDPLVRAFITHYQFEAIHPFGDGNGRVGRILLEMTAAKLTGTRGRWIYLSDYFDRNAAEYRRLLFRLSTHSEWEPWIRFCLEGVIQTSRNTITRVDQLLELKNEFVRRMRPHETKRTRRLIDYLFEKPMLTTTQVKEEFDCAFDTAKAEIESLVAAGILAESPSDKKPKTFMAKDIIQVAYGS